MDFSNTCRTCMIKGNQEKDLISITKYCALGKSYKHVLLSLAPNMDGTFLPDDNCVCENCAETLKRSALLIHNCLMIEKKLRAISSQLRKNEHKDITKENCIQKNIIPISEEVTIDDKNTENCITRALEILNKGTEILNKGTEILNKGTCVSVDLATAENIHKPSQNDYTKQDFQHDNQVKSEDSNNDSSISPNSTNLLNTLLDGVKKHDSVISLNPSDRPFLENQLSRLMEHGINIFDLSRNNEEDGKDVRKRIILIGFDQPTQCPICSKLIKYSKVHDCPKLFRPEGPNSVQKCNLCNKLVKGSLLDIHLQKHAQNRKRKQMQNPAGEKRKRGPRPRQDFTCETCSEKFTSKQEFELHLKLHPLFICEICSKGFVRKHSLKSHMVSHNNQSRYICEICGKGFKEKHGLRAHLETHRDDKSYPCAYCPKVFKLRLGVTQHTKLVHEKSFRCQCLECGKFFCNEMTLKSHVRLVHLKEKPYRCHICQKMFGREDYLRNHIARHAVDGPVRKGGRKTGYILPKYNGKPGPCKFCGRRFADLIRLERHLKTHFKRFKCQFCPLTFAYKNFCVRHERVVHKGVMSNFFRCNVCWKRLVSKEALDEHLERHNKPRYTCDQCGKKFNKRFVMNHHQLVDHFNMPDKDEVNKIIYNSLVEASTGASDIKSEDLLC